MLSYLQYVHGLSDTSTITQVIKTDDHCWSNPVSIHSILKLPFHLFIDLMVTCFLLSTVKLSTNSISGYSSFLVMIVVSYRYLEIEIQFCIFV